MKISVFDRFAEKVLSYPVVRNIYSEKVKRELRILYPAKETEQMIHIYYRDKISFLLKIWCIGIIFLILVIAAQTSDSLLKEENVLNREEVSLQPVMLNVFDEENHAAEIEYEVQSESLTKEETEAQAERFLSEYESLICGKNESLQKVHTDLLLQDTYDTYALDFVWESSDYRLVGEDGEVANDELLNNQTVQLTVWMTYKETEYVHTFTIQVVPPMLTEAQQWEKEIRAAIATEDERQKYDENLQLPSVVGGKNVTYEEKKEVSVFLLFLLLPVVSMVLFWAKDRDLTKETELRKKRMDMKYPEFVSKVQLLFGAGMTVRNIFLQLSEDKSLGKELTEETALMVRDMKNGISIRDALDRFGKRTGNPLYIKFSALLIQNMKKGTDDLAGQLAKEVSEAFILRKTNARRQGEEVGTKLLGPMILMLGVVMAILMIPAFLSFQF